MSVTYNGYTFDPKTSNATGSAEFQYDEADRMLVAVVWRFRVKAIITPTYVAGQGTSTAIHMAEIRKRLAEPGKKFSIANYGFGPNLIVNAEAGYVPAGGEIVTRDLKFGPKPRVLSWTPIGFGNAAEVEWSIDVIISPCGDALQTAFSGLSAAVFSITFNINSRGWTTRTVSGYLTIAQTYDATTGRPADSPDLYRYKIDVTVMANAHREQTYPISADKTRLDWSIVDREIESPNAYPPGVTHIEVTNRFINRIPTSRTQNEITATIELAADQPRTKAIVIFAALVDEIRQPLIDNNIQFINESLSGEESKFSNRFSFSFRWRTFLALEAFLNSNVMFQNLDYDWLTWSGSMATIQSSRGLAGAVLEASSDNITNLCNPEDVRVTTGAVPEVPPPADVSTFCNPLPSPGDSWLEFRGYLKDRLEYKTKPHKSLGAPSATRTNFSPGDPNGTLTQINTGGYVRNYAQSPQTQYWQWSGYAVRVGYPIPKPDQTKIGGKDVIPVGEQNFICHKIGEMFCQPVYAAAWNMLFVVDETPDGNAVQEQTKPINP